MIRLARDAAFTIGSREGQVALATACEARQGERRAAFVDAREAGVASAMLEQDLAGVGTAPAQVIEFALRIDECERDIGLVTLIAREELAERLGDRRLRRDHDFDEQGLVEQREHRRAVGCKRIACVA